MKPFLQELFQYNHAVNQALIGEVARQPNKKLAKSRELLSHILNVHQIWNGKIQSQEPSVDAWQVHRVEDMQDTDAKNFKLSLFLLETVELTDVVKWTTRSGAGFQNSVQDMLFHVINHSTYHRAQIANDFRQNGIEPLLTDYIYFKMKDRSHPLVEE